MIISICIHSSEIYRKKIKFYELGPLFSFLIFFCLFFQSILHRLHREELLLHRTQVANLYQYICLPRNLMVSFHYSLWFQFLLFWLLIKLINYLRIVIVISDLTIRNIRKLAPKLAKFFFKTFKSFRQIFCLLYILLAADSLASNSDFTAAILALCQSSWNYKVISLAVWIWIGIKDVLVFDSIMKWFTNNRHRFIILPRKTLFKIFWLI